MMCHCQKCDLSYEKINDYKAVLDWLPSNQADTSQYKAMSLVVNLKVTI